MSNPYIKKRKMSQLQYRKSIRLKGYDYSQPGDYFVTICTKNRVCIFGEIGEGRMTANAIGEVVEECWKSIPEHFQNSNVDVFQIMPNHVHGIITIEENASVGVRHVEPLPKAPRQNKFQHIVPGSLGSIIRSFKAAVTKETRLLKLVGNKSHWQRNFYDHIIRNDVSYFFIQQYIELNPLLWHLDSDNPTFSQFHSESFAEEVKRRFGLNDNAIQYLIDHEVDYQAWKEKEGDE